MKKSPEFKNPYFTNILLGILLLILFFLRISKLWDTGLFDYDSAKNYLILKELYEANFSNLFHHSSPGFYLIYFPVFALFKNFIAIEFFTAALNLLSIWVLTQYFKKHFNLNKTYFFLLLAFVGSSVYQIVSSRYLAMEALSQLLFILAFISYHNSLHKPEEKEQLIFTKIILAFAIGVNYKFILVILVFATYELLFAKRKWTIQNLLTTGIIFSIPVLFYTALGWLVDIGWDNYLKHFFVQAFIKDMNPNESLSKFNLDFFYYFKYFLHFENPLSWIGIFTFIIIYKQKSWEKPILKLTLFMILAFFLGMSLLQKAPRGLLFIFPLIYSLGFLGLISLPVKNWMKMGLLFLGIAVNLFLAQKNIWQFSDTAYPKLASVLDSGNITKVTSTAGLGIAPFLSDHIQLKAVLNIEEINQLKGNGYHYVIIDSYYKVINAKAFDDLMLNSPKIIFEEQETSLASPYLFLEHSEYTGLGFDETLLLRKKAMENGLMIRLLKFE